MTKKCGKKKSLLQLDSLQRSQTAQMNDMQFFTANGQRCLSYNGNSDNFKDMMTLNWDGKGAVERRQNAAHAFGATSYGSHWLGGTGAPGDNCPGYKFVKVAMYDGMNFNLYEKAKENILMQLHS